MKRTRMMLKVLLLVASSLPLALPVGAVAGTVTVVSDGSWNVFDANGNWLGLSQSVCLNATNPSNCPVGAAPAPTLYGYPRPGWTANLSSLPTSARWIWAPNITGASSPAASQEFTFETEFYLCEPPLRGTVYIAADDSAEVSVNGTTLPNSTTTGHSALHSVNVPAAILLGSTPLSIRPNRITVRARNGLNPADCASNEYRCNPAGVVFGASFEFQGDPPCAGFKGGTYSNGQSETLSSCPAGQTGSVFHTCLCGHWTPNLNTCAVTPPTCTGSNGRVFSVGDAEALSCPPGQVGSASRTCQSNGTWAAPDTSSCRAPPPPAPTCSGLNGRNFAVGATEALSCVAGTGSPSRTCLAGGAWGPTQGGCALREGDVCGSSQTGYIQACPPGTCIANCPAGTDCKNRRAGPVLVTTDWFCDR